MTIFLNILFLIIGMVFLIKGADLFVSGASAIAKRFKIPSLFIGLTVVALGTSLPELSVSLAGAFKNNVDMSVGNIVGSNFMNLFLIFGITLLIKPTTISNTSKKLDFPFLIGLTFVLLLFSVDTYLNGADANIITRSESILLLLALVVYMTLSIFGAKKEHQLMYEKPDVINIEDIKKEKKLKVWQMVLFIVLGLGGVVFGAECVSTTAQFLALKLGISEALVGLTIVAIGTSLPELATAITAAIKKDEDLAIGNLIGSNIFNIALILGSVGVIKQISVSSLILVDILILFVFTLIASIICMAKKNLPRWIGILFIFMYVAYLTFAIVRNYCF